MVQTERGQSEDSEVATKAGHSTGTTQVQAKDPRAGHTLRRSRSATTPRTNAQIFMPSLYLGLRKMRMGSVADSGAPVARVPLDPRVPNQRTQGSPISWHSFATVERGVWTKSHLLSGRSSFAMGRRPCSSKNA